MKWSLNHLRLGTIAGHLGLCLVLVFAAVPAYSASATGFKTVDAAGGSQFATVWRLRGEVVASAGEAGQDRKLGIGDPVYVGDRIRAAPLAEAVLKTEDAGLVAIRPSTEFVAERFVAEDKPTDSFTMRLLTGSLRVISGWIARTNRSGHSIVTASATIGIRGTDHEPYVLSAELAKATANPEGTYDKVNRGGTTMIVGESKLDIDSGKVGFVRAKKKVRERALMTILLPVLLDKVPNFYVPGEFDAELDRLSQTADQDSLQKLEKRRSETKVTPVDECDPTTVAKDWLARLDGAIARNDAPAIIGMFAGEVEVRARIRDTDGKMVSVDIGRDEFVQSTLAAMKGLQDYKQRRVWTVGKLESPAGMCNRVSVRSVVVEQGRQSGKPYRFESLEEYVLELHAGEWIAVKAETTQQ